MQQADLLELRDDLYRERQRLQRLVNGGTPSRGEGWHRRLLERMAMNTDTRPSVLRESTQQQLQEYLRFRHLVRNFYADELKAEPIQQLIVALETTWRDVAKDLDAFQCWLSAINANGN